MREREIKEKEFLDEVAAGAAVEKKFTNCLFSNMVITGANLQGFVFEECTFMDCEFRCCYMNEVTFKDSSLYSVDFEMCSLKGAHFSATTIGARFNYSVLENAVFDQCNFRDGYMCNVTISGAEFSLALFNGTWVGNLIITEPVKLSGCRYTMGGATNEEVERASDNFFTALVGHPLGKAEL